VGKTLEETANERKGRAGEKFQLKCSLTEEDFSWQGPAFCEKRCLSRGVVRRSYPLSLFHLPGFLIPNPTPMSCQSHLPMIRLQRVTGKQVPQGREWEHTAP